MEQARRGAGLARAACKQVAGDGDRELVLSRLEMLAAGI
jgi:hypothetical protein